jgi:hypothetical protein
MSWSITKTDTIIMCLKVTCSGNDIADNIAHLALNENNLAIS